MDQERKSLIIARARRLVERGKSEREDVLADLEQRKSNDLTIPTLPVDRGQLVFKRHETPPQKRGIAALLPPDTPTPTADDDWTAWVNARIESAMMDVMTLVGSELGRMSAETDARIQRLTDAVESLRDESRSNKASHAKPDIQLPPWSRSWRDGNVN
jgi:hypothetical protein